MLLIFHPQKTEYEIETKETMQREQKVIVLRTMAYCNVLCEDKRLLNWFSDARKRHFKVVISQNFPCGAGRGKPPPPPSPSPALSLRRRRSFVFWRRGAASKVPFFEKKTDFTFPSFTRNGENVTYTLYRDSGSIVEIWAASAPILPTSW